jgi:cytidylate kinase
MFEEFDAVLRNTANEAGEGEPPWYDVQAHRSRALRANAGKAASSHRGPFIIISRLPGAGGGEIGERVGASLGWPVLGKQLIGRMAQRFQVDPDLLEMLDENTSNFLYEAFGHLLNHEFVSQNAYVSYLRKTVHAAAKDGPAVFIGRGVQYFLPRSRSLLVRIVADDCDRVERFEQRYHVDRKLAEKIVRETTERRAAFVRRFFHRDLDDSAAYDLVVNSSRLGLEGCADAILAALKSSGLEQPVTANASS